MINKTHPLEIEKQAATNINLNDKFTKEATDAVSYLSLVKKETQSQPEVYNQFLQLLNDFSLNR
jgi:histone deacetylase complex regulatory component SIN3